LIKKKNAANEELLIVMRRQINVYRNQKAAAIDCLATSALKCLGKFKSSPVTGLDGLEGEYMYSSTLS
jgi:hypothetical protein